MSVKVWVVMGNDYPDAVFTTEAAAKAYCEEQKKKSLYPGTSTPRIYWRTYEFELRDEK